SGIQYQLGPISKVNPCAPKALALPPGESFFSKRVTAHVPRSARCVAAERPAKPDPMTTTCFDGIELVFVHIHRQVILKQLAGDMNAVFHSADRNLQRVGDLKVLETTEIHLKGNLVYLVELIDGGSNIRKCKAPVDSILDGRTRRVEIVEIIRGVHKCAPSHHSLIVGDKGVSHDGIEPRLEI